MSTRADGTGAAYLSVESGRVLTPAAEKTGEWVVAIYESTGSLLALHGPYPSPGEAQHAAKSKQDRDRADIYPLFRADHVGRD